MTAIIVEMVGGYRLSVGLELRPEHRQEATLPSHTDPTPVGPDSCYREAW
jgi:hypothetical protein